MGKTMKQINLNNHRDKLTEQDIDELVALLGSRCREKSLRLLRAHLTYSASAIPHYGILERVIKENGQWTYVPGQSYSDEIRTVRKIIIDLK